MFNWRSHALLEHWLRDRERQSDGKLFVEDFDKCNVGIQAVRCLDYDRISPARAKLIEMFKENKSRPALSIFNSRFQG